VVASGIAEHVGRVLGDRYRLIRPLGTGASAHVYVAEDVSLRRRVAVKLLHPGLAKDESFLRRFQAEARVVAALRHPNIVRVYDWGEDEGAPYLIMELLEGGSLLSMLDRGHLLTPAQAVAIGIDAAKALDYAHRRGLVHRDIKPANLLFDDEARVCIADFGLARALAEAAWTDPAGAVLGTARYAAPEQVRGAALDGRADVYALTLVLVEAVTGKVPFAADTTIGTLMGRLDRPLPVGDELGPLGPVLRLAGAPNADERMDAGELARALERVGGLLPPPGRVTLAGPLDTGEVEEDAELTELPRSPAAHAADVAETAQLPSPPAPPAPPELETTRDGEPTAPDPLPVNSDIPRALRSGPGQSRSKHRGRRLLVVLVLLAALIWGVSTLITRTVVPSHPVPDVQGKTVDAAQGSLSPLHLHLQVVGQVFDETVPKDAIVNQQPAVASQVKEGSAVTVRLSAGPPPVPVPDLARLNADQASQRLIGAGLVVGKTTNRPDATIPAGMIISWTGQGGQVTKGSPVDLVLSSGPPQVPVPPTIGGSFASAKAALAGVGLVAVEDDQFSDTVAQGVVVSSTPASGVPAIVGSQVRVVVSKGQDLVTVPPVSGQTVDVATKGVQAAGLTVSGVTGSPDRPVTATAPAIGTRIKRGSSVKLSTS
jgi:serine/threonine-protein kinase